MQALVDRAIPDRVCVLYTGGTIGMRSISPELQPDQPPMLEPDEIEFALRQRSDLDVPYDFQPLIGSPAATFKPLVSSQILPEHWVQIAKSIQHYYSDYAGFVVLHGTDTMAWTASALSFMFMNLSKPIVLTGSQRPIFAAPSDAVANFVNSVMIAGQGAESIPLIPEVVICFGDLVLRGNRSTKVSTASLQGFDSPNAPHVGRVGRRFDVSAEQIRHPPALVGGECFARLEIEPRVADVVLYPGMQASQIERALEGNAGAVLRSFGAGNAPGGQEVEDVLRAAVKAGKVLVNVTQSNEGTVEGGMLSGTRALTDCGVVSGLDLTAEAALTKLMVLLGSETPEVAMHQMQLDQRGEQSIDLVELRAGLSQRDPDGVCRVVLAPSLHARARADRLMSAVLRLRGTVVKDGDPYPAKAALFLNHWRADWTTEPDLRSLGTHSFIRNAARGTFGVVLDVTEVARQVLDTGAPVTVTIVPLTSAAPGEIDIDVVLSLFMARAVAQTN